MPKTQIFVKIVASGGIGPPLVPYDGVLLVKLLYNSLTRNRCFFTVLPLH